MTKTQKNKSADGFTLVELAIVVAITGVILAFAVAFALPIMETARRLDTEGKMEKVAAALSQYAVNNYRLPCPADPANPPAGGEPFGTERGSDAAGYKAPGDCGGQTVGIVPFRVLGLGRQFATDGYGNAFTYAISPAFSQDTRNDLMLVHAQCRTNEWYGLVSDDLTSASSRKKVFFHRNPRKAHFCCPDIVTFAANTDLIVEDENGLGALTLPRQAPAADVQSTFCPPVASCTGFDCCSAGYETVARPYSTEPNVPLLPTVRTTAVAYTLLSHGPNGQNAAYTIGAGTRPAAPPADPGEAENADDDRTFRDIFAKSDQYDDVVLWRTQELIYAERGESCIVP